jgi:signal transduction histidine kinase/ActR/RegA family two-component response regulator
MRFKNPLDEQRFLDRLWVENRTVIRLFSIVCILHTGFIIIVSYDSSTYFTATSYLFIYGVYVPIPIAITLFSFDRPLQKRWKRTIWYTLLTILSIMFAFGISFRTLLCQTGVENPAACTESSRPVASSNFVIIYFVLGPFLILNIMRNSILYEIPAILIILTLLTFLVLKYSPTINLLTYLTLLFVIGAQLMGILVARNREKVERATFIADAKNILLQQDLQNQINAKTEAQEKARKEEELRNQVTSMVFHDVRVPLNSVVLSVDDLESDETWKQGLSPEAKDNIHRINMGLTNIVNILNESLDMRKIAEGKMQLTFTPFVYHEMILDISTAMESGSKSKNIAYKLNLDKRIDSIPYRVLGDEQKLGQVVANYLSNAFKFTPQGGRVTLSTHLEGLNEQFADIYTEVSDTGVGIKEEDQAKLFQPYVQIDPGKLQGGKGSGLGLHICATIIRSMKGEYGLKSKYGAGSTFWFRVHLPLTDVPKYTDISSETGPGTSAPERTFKILVTDDDESNRKIVRKLLERWKNTVDEAVDGVDCTEKVEKGEMNRTPYDIIFIDNQMPRMDGIEAIRLIREKHYDYEPYIIVLSGSAETSFHQSLRDAGANQILVKPAKKDMIEMALRSVPGHMGIERVKD